MKNLKFGALFLGLVAAIVAAVSSLGAQTRAFEIAEGRQVEPRDRNGREVMLFDGRGSQLGVMISDVDSGVRIDEVNAGSPAEKAGIKAGDVIVEYDGERVRGARQLTRLVQETPEGRAVKIGLLRDGKRQTVDATPENSAMTWNFGPDIDRAMRDAERGFRQYNFRFPGGIVSGSRGRLGITVQSLTPDLEEYFGAKGGGALVSSVTRESAAAKAGIRAGDVITSIDGTRIADTDDLMRAVEDAAGETKIVLIRDKKEMTLNAVIEDRPQGSRPKARPGSRPGN